MKRFVMLLLTLLFSAFAFAAVNINTATREELDALPEIGPVKAQAIVDYRNANGPFKTPDDVMKVSGIKEGTFSKIKGMISVSGASTPVAGTATKADAKMAPAMKAASPAAAPAPAPAMAPAPAAKSTTPAAATATAPVKAAPAGAAPAKDATMTKAEQAKVDKTAKAAAKAKAKDEKAAAAKAKKDAKAAAAKSAKDAKATTAATKAATKDDATKN